MTAFKRIIAATDFSETSRRAVDLAIELAQEHAAALVLVHVLEPFLPPYPIDPLTIPASAEWVESLETATREQLDKELALVRAKIPHAVTELLHGNASDELVRFAEQQQADLLVLGTHGRSGPSRWFMGSVAEKTVRHSHVPVLTVNHEQPSEHHAPAAHHPSA